MQNLRGIIEALSKTLDINHRSVLNAVTSKLHLLESDAPQIEIMDEEMNEESEVRKKIKFLCYSKLLAIRYFFRPMLLFDA